MKLFLLNLIFLLYLIISLLILVLAAFCYPIMKAPNDPYISPYLLYPLALIVCASQNKIVSYFLSKIKEFEKDENIN